MMEGDCYRPCANPAVPGGKRLKALCINHENRN